MERSADVTRTSGRPGLSIGPGAKLETAETVLTLETDLGPRVKVPEKHGTGMEPGPRPRPAGTVANSESRSPERAQVPADAAAGAASSIAGPGARRQ